MSTIDVTPIGTTWFFDQGRLALRYHDSTGYEVRWGRSHRFVPLHRTKAENILATRVVERTEPFDPERAYRLRTRRRLVWM